MAWHLHFLAVPDLAVALTRALWQVAPSVSVEDLDELSSLLQVIRLCHLPSSSLVRGVEMCVPPRVGAQMHCSPACVICLANVLLKGISCLLTSNQLPFAQDNAC